MKKVTRIALISGVVVLLLLVAGFILAGIFGLLLDVLYISLIVLAALSMLSTIFLIYAVLVLVNAITTVRNEIKPLMTSMEETMDLLKDTAKVAGETASSIGNTATVIGSTAQLTKEFAVKPTVRAAAFVIASQQMVRIFMGKGRVQSRAEKRRKEQMKAVERMREGK
jgi:hypothetical protein